MQDYILSLILASSSPRRKELLKQIGFIFEVDVTNFEEVIDQNSPPEMVVKELAEGKSADAALRHPHSLILAADTVVCVNNIILGKPKDLEQAKQMLRLLSNTYHDVITGVTLINTQNQKRCTNVVKSRIYFRQIAQVEIEHYVTQYQPLDKAGGYGLQEFSGIFAERIEGDYFNIIGLPIYKLPNMFAEIGENYFDYIK